MNRLAIVACLLFSGLTALVYQLVWTRLLGLSFGTTTEAIATVLAVFFGGLALGNWLAARALVRLSRPLRVYAALEFGIGAWALASLPILWNLDSLHALAGAPESRAALGALRFAAAALLLLPPTLAMGATLPVVARALITRDEVLGRWSAWLYGANTVGAVLGAYACGFWAIPLLGLTHTLVAAGCTNLAVGALAWWAGRDAEAHAPRPVETPAPADAPSRRAFLFYFAVSGFVAIGYEIVWSKVFGIVMEGTLYGFAAVLSAYLLGIASGSLAIAPFVDRLRNPARAFALLHVAIGGTVALGIAGVPYLPHAYEALARVAKGADAIHLLYLVVLPIVWLPTALFGAAFPILIRIYTERSDGVGRGMGMATAVNTAGSIVASLTVGFWWIPAWGTDAVLYALLWIDFGAALAALLGNTQLRGPARAGALGGSLAMIALVTLAFGGVHIEEAVAGRQLGAPDLTRYREALEKIGEQRALSYEGKASIVTVYTNPSGRRLQTNGMPESGVNLAPPHFSSETVALAVWPYALAAQPERALVIGLGAGNTVASLLRTPIPDIEVVELEPGVERAVELLHEGMPNPLHDPRVSLKIDDGRNYLLRRNARGAPGYDVISSQPSHPWRVGAANLFTEDFFRVARASLREGGIFAAWLNGFRTDSAGFLAVVTSFERVFPGALLVDLAPGRQAFLLVGGRAPLELDLEQLRRRIAIPAVAGLLAEQDVHNVSQMLARIEGPARIFAALEPSAANTDDNAFVETRSPRELHWSELDFAPIEQRLPADAPVLPPLRGALDGASMARALLATARDDGSWPYAAKLRRLLGQLHETVPASERDLLLAEADLRDPQRESDALAVLRRLVSEQPTRPEALRVLGTHLALRRSEWREAGDAFARAWARTHAASDAYDAGRALYPIDHAGARAWFGRIPEAERGAYPRLAFYDAAAALERGLRGEALDGYARALERFVRSDAGYAYPGAQELASRVAWARGDVATARRHADVDAQQRQQQAKNWIKRAEAAIEKRDYAAAKSALDRAEPLAPADGRVAWSRAELALAERNEQALEHALEALRSAAPSLAAGIGSENAFRSAHGMPLRAEQESGSGSS
jgi:spermidine synthase